MTWSTKHGLVINTPSCKTNGDPETVNRREVMPVGGPMFPLNPIYYHHAFAANGSRLHPFITNRKAAGALLVQAKIETAFSIPLTMSTHLQVSEGAGYIGAYPAPLHGSNMLATVYRAA